MEWWAVSLIKKLLEIPLPCLYNYRYILLRNMNGSARPEKG
ncbi:hypothetical protein COPEUT_00547 [Coprococcus eutactus ATCC 27759]|nr:hypothetical protein COPEUT_00547 [Coprococcus eutactus ATCC 27759]